MKSPDATTNQGAATHIATNRTTATVRGPLSGPPSLTTSSARSDLSTASRAGSASWSTSAAGSGRTPPLPNDWTSTWLIMLVAAAMGFLASLGVAAVSGVDALAKSWTQELSSRATVLLAIEADDSRALADALEAIRQVDGVTSAQPLDDAALQALVAPWLGDDTLYDELPLPRMIDVTTAPGIDLPAEKIEAQLAQLGVEADVDAHGEWVERLRPPAERIQRLAYGALFIVAVAAALTVSLACSAALAAQAKVIDVLKLVGAEDRYITRIFVRRFQLLAFGGSALGAALAAAALLGAGEATTGFGQAELAPLLPSLQPRGLDWAQFTAIPLAFALIATISAQISVGVSLRRLER